MHQLDQPHDDEKVFFQAPGNNVPEPASRALCVMALVGLAAARGRHRET